MTNKTNRPSARHEPQTPEAATASRTGRAGQPEEEQRHGHGRGRDLLHVGCDTAAEKLELWALGTKDVGRRHLEDADGVVAGDRVLQFLEVLQELAAQDPKPGRRRSAIAAPSRSLCAGTVPVAGVADRGRVTNQAITHSTDQSNTRGRLRWAVSCVFACRCHSSGAPVLR